MTAMFPFAEPTVPSFQEMIERVRNDDAFPEKSKRDCVSSMIRTAQWVSVTSKSRPRLTAAQVPFTSSAINAIFRTLSAQRLGLKKKTLDNARSDLRRVCKHYRLRAVPARIPLTPELQHLKDLLPNPHHKVELGRLLSHLAAENIHPKAVSDSILAGFQSALALDVTVRDSELAFKRALRAWNRAAARVPGWPQGRLTLPRVRKIWGWPLTSFAGLHSEAYAFLARKRQTHGLFVGGKVVYELAEQTIKTQLENVRMAACALVHEGIRPELLGNLRSVLIPERYKSAINHLTVRAGGKVTYSVKQTAYVLTKLARHSGVLERAELEAVEQAYEEVCAVHKEFLKDHVHRAEALIAQFDDDVVMDSLLLLGGDTLRALLKFGRITRGSAYAYQAALILELWLCSPLRSLNLRALRFEDHFVTGVENGVEIFVIRIRKGELKNKVDIKHPLTPELSAWVRTYVEVYRSKIVRMASPYLFPGAEGGLKTAQALRIQMARFIKKGTGARFHPHLIRRVVTKIILDEDPNAIEVAVAKLGHTNDRMVRKVYRQKQQSAAHRAYLEALESRRLRAFRSTKIRRKRT